MLLMGQYRFSRGKIKPNDHYDGTRFFNPWKRDSHGFREFLKIAGEINRNSWPRWIDIPPQKPPSGRVTSGLCYSVVNHSTVLLQTRGVNFLTDPVYSERTSPFSFLGPRRVHRPGIAFQELPPIDVVLVSHNHYDHLDLETLQKLEMKFHPVFITALGNALFLKARGLKNVVELDWWESHSVLDTEFTLTPAQHFSSRSMRDRDQSLWGGFYIKTLDYKIFFAADSGYCPCFKEIAERLGNPDLSFIPIGAYEPRWFMRTVHMNPDDAVLAHRDLGSQQSVGIHFGCFKLTAESIDAPIADLTKALAKYEVEAKKFYAPEFGRIYTL